MTEVLIKDLSSLRQAAEEFLIKKGDATIIAFYGSMGAGKTTFITSLCSVLGVNDIVNSPTFTIVNEYADRNGQPVYHFDFYRINKISEAQDIGFDEYMDSGNLCLIEWPENIEEILPEEVLKVHIRVNPDDSRLLEF